MLRASASRGANVLFAVGTWGLGHATRSLPLIRGLLGSGHTVTVLGNGASLQLLRSELGVSCEFIDFPGMRVPLGRTPFRFYLKYTLMLPLIWRDTVRQHQLLGGLLNGQRFDAIVSDNCYAVWSTSVPSFLLTHGLRFIAPGRNHTLELGLEWFNAMAFRYYRKILVPDFPTNDLSGDLSHRLLFYEPSRVHYLGLLSSVGQEAVEHELDVFISVSGPEPQRTILARRVLQQLPNVKRQGLVALGRPGNPQRWRVGDWEIANFLNRAEQQMALNRCAHAVVRAGYTTLMELATLGKPATLIPTPGQTEQEYLVEYHARLGHYGAADQDTLSLAHIPNGGARDNPYRPPHLTDTSVQRFLQALFD